MAGRPLRRSRQLMNPVEFDTSRAASMREMKQKWAKDDLGPWLPGVRSRLVKTGEKLIPKVRVILPDINNRFTVDQVTPEIGVMKILASSENAGPHALKGVNFWHRLFDDPLGIMYLVPESVKPADYREWAYENVPNLERLRPGLPGTRQVEFNRALSSTAYARRQGKSMTMHDLHPIVRSNLTEPGWVTEEDRQADAMASILGFIRGLRYSVLLPGQIYRIKTGAAQGLTPEQAASDYDFLDELPTPAEEAELRAVIAPLEEYTTRVLQHQFAKAAAIGMVFLWEQPRAAQGAPYSEGPEYVPSKAAIQKLLKRARPPAGWKLPGT